MARAVRIGAVAAGLFMLGLLALPPVNRPLLDGVAAVRNWMDLRPERSVLFIGNSRTFSHGMPWMVRQIADSAGYGEKLRIEMEAPAGVTLADHLANPEVTALLERHWDHVVLQAQSGEQLSAERSERFQETARALIGMVEAGGGRPAMFVTWRYLPSCTDNAGLQPGSYDDMHESIQEQHRRLAEDTGVDLVNVGAVWEALEAEGLEVSLYEDCNHPSVAGSYLAALMFYRYLSGDGVAVVTFRPDGLAPEVAQRLRDAVAADAE